MKFSYLYTNWCFTPNISGNLNGLFFFNILLFMTEIIFKKSYEDHFRFIYHCSQCGAFRKISHRWLYFQHMVIHICIFFRTSLKSLFFVHYYPENLYEINSCFQRAAKNNFYLFSKHYKGLFLIILEHSWWKLTKNHFEIVLENW